MLTTTSNKAIESSQSSPPVQTSQVMNYDTNPLPAYNELEVKGDDAVIGADYQKALFARCARGDHQGERQFGIVGILTAAIIFPIGLICLFMDSHKICSRCGVVLPKTRK